MVPKPIRVSDPDGSPKSEPPLRGVSESHSDLEMVPKRRRRGVQRRRQADKPRIRNGSQPLPGQRRARRRSRRHLSALGTETSQLGAEGFVSMPAAAVTSASQDLDGRDELRARELYLSAWLRSAAKYCALWRIRQF
jgi:hypothetical protein